MIRVYIEKFNGNEGAILEGEKLVPHPDVEVWLDPQTGIIKKKSNEGTTWSHLLHVLGHEFILREFKEQSETATVVEQAEVPAPRGRGRPKKANSAAQAEHESE